MVKKVPTVGKNSRSTYTENRIGKMCGTWKSVWDMEICAEGLEQE